MALNPATVARLVQVVRPLLARPTATGSRSMPLPVPSWA